MLGLNLDPYQMISRLFILLIAFPIHEFAHAWTADYFGDDTPRMNGRLTLNPLAHLDLMGSLLVFVSGFGWAKPVPVNPYQLNRRSPSALMWVSLAGPLSNFVLAALAAVPLRFGLVGADGVVRTILLDFIFVNLLLMVFNLIPLAPLDGDKVADYLFPPAWSRAMETIRPYGPIILLALLFVLPYAGIDVIGWLIIPPIRFLAQLLIG